jgi:hypothetical protein
MICEGNTLNYEWIDRTSIIGAIFLFYRHDECKYGKPRNEYCYIVIYWTFDTGNR